MLLRLIFLSQAPRAGCGITCVGLVYQDTFYHSRAVLILVLQLLLLVIHLPYHSFHYLSSSLSHAPPRFLANHSPTLLSDFGPSPPQLPYLLPSSLLFPSSPLAFSYVIAGIMTQLVALEASKGNKQVIADAKRIVGLSADDSYVPLDAKEV